MHEFFDNKSDKFIFTEPEGDFLWYGRMLLVLGSFDKDLIDLSLKLDKTALENMFDLSSLRTLSLVTNNDVLIKYFSEIPGAEIKGKISAKSQAKHLMLMNYFAAAIYFINHPESKRTDALSSLSYIYKIIETRVDFKVWFEEIVSIGTSNEILRKDFHI